jgi:hypothetical protein
MNPSLDAFLSRLVHSFPEFPERLGQVLRWYVKEGWPDAMGQASAAFRLFEPAGSNSLDPPPRGTVGLG